MKELRKTLSIFIGHWSVALSFMLIGFELIGAKSMEVHQMMPVIALLILAGHHIANGFTAMIEIYRHGAKRGQFENQTLTPDA